MAWDINIIKKRGDDLSQVVGLIFSCSGWGMEIEKTFDPTLYLVATAGCALGRIKKQSCFSSPSLLTFGCRITFFFFFYKNADNALEIELKRSKIEMPLSFLKDFYT